jgi:hypothetical protein
MYLSPSKHSQSKYTHRQNDGVVRLLPLIAQTLAPILPEIVPLHSLPRLMLVFQALLLFQNTSVYILNRAPPTKAQTPDNSSTASKTPDHQTSSTSYLNTDEDYSLLHSCGSACFVFCFRLQYLCYIQLLKSHSQCLELELRWDVVVSSTRPDSSEQSLTSFSSSWLLILRSHVDRR